MSLARDISLLSGPEWDVPVEWNADGDKFGILFGDYAFFYGITGGPGVPCPLCGLWHWSGGPHAPTKLFWHKFIEKHRRFPHWCDLIFYCRGDWFDGIRDFLESRGQWSVPKDGLTEEDATARAVGGLSIHSLEEDPKAYPEIMKGRIGASLDRFVGMPNDETAREQIKKALDEAMAGVDAKIEVGAHPRDSHQMEIKVVYVPTVPKDADIRIADVHLIGMADADGGNADGEGLSGSGPDRPEAYSASTRDAREDRPYMSTPHGKSG